MAFIEHHGWFAAITKDGLLATAAEASRDSWTHEHGDTWYDAPRLFEVDHDGMVSSREVREWLGY